MLRYSKRKSKSPYARPVRTPAERSIAATAPVVMATQVSQPASQTANSSVATINPPEVPQPPEVPHSASMNSDSTVATPNPLSIGDITTEQSLTSGENPLISITDELGVHVPQAIKENIWSKQYIDLAKVIISEIDNQDTHKFSIVEGQLVIEPKTKTTKIITMQSWVDAFLIFASIYLARHPSDIQGILKYIHTVRLGYSRNTNANWLEYDRQFRLKMSKNTSLSFGSVDAELWLIYMQAQPSLIAPQPKASLKCFDYNLKGSCSKSQCFYQHECMHCNKTHPRIHCWAYQSTLTQSSRPNTNYQQSNTRLNLTRPTAGQQNYAQQSYSNFRPYCPRQYQSPTSRFNTPRFYSN
ncbi:uncharacterized protein LOC134272901 [Saccostrea cucullata]|uniref:uncharacterized protein LOC134272901 n=1 Tax=Saccostrea cuccullata TaxID=36930 RepID=UPI002ED4A2D0